jgi:hypothetical protein
VIGERKEQTVFLITYLSPITLKGWNSVAFKDVERGASKLRGTTFFSLRLCLSLNSKLKVYKVATPLERRGSHARFLVP